jgi:hypothetical protein
MAVAVARMAEVVVVEAARMAEVAAAITKTRAFYPSCGFDEPCAGLRHHADVVLGT